MHILLHSAPTQQQPPPTHASIGDSRTPPGKSGTVSCGVTAPSSWVLVHKVLLFPPRVYFPVRCKFWQLYGEVNGDLLQEGLCHTQVCCTQSPCPCGNPYLYIYIYYSFLNRKINPNFRTVINSEWRVELESKFNFCFLKKRSLKQIAKN